MNISCERTETWVESVGASLPVVSEEEEVGEIVSYFHCL